MKIWSKRKKLGKRFSILAKPNEQGQHVSVDITVKYGANSSRPTEFIVNYFIDNKFYTKSILN